MPPRLLASMRVDAQITGDRENPGRRPGACRVKQSGLPPDRQHRLLRQFLGSCLAGAGTLHESFDPRSKILEQGSQTLLRS